MSFIKSAVLFLCGIFVVSAQAFDTVEIVVPWPPGGGIDFQAQSLASAAAKLHPQVTVKRTYLNSCSLALEHAAAASRSHPTYLLGDIGDIIFSDPSKGSRCPPLNTVPVSVRPVSKLGHVPIMLCHAGQHNIADIRKKRQILVGHSATTAFTVIGKQMQNEQYRMVPYKGTAQAKIALQAGDVDMLFIGGHTALPMMKEGAKCVAASSDSGIAGLPSLSQYFGRPIDNWDSLILMFRIGNNSNEPDWLHKVAQSQEFSAALATRHLLNGSLDLGDVQQYIVAKEAVLFRGN